MPYWRVIAAAAVGNALEWFDFTLYGFLAVTMGRVFFPAADGRTGLLLAFATFGVPFVVRPIGAWILGRFGDRHGRKSGLIRTIVLMIVATAMMALTPPYSAIGLAAPAIVLLARLLQGFSAGGEFGNATVFLAEQHRDRRGFLASWQFAGQAFSAFLVSSFGLALNLTLTPGQLQEWGWRIPFLFGLLIGPLGYFVRRNALETPEFQAPAPAEISARRILSEARNRLFISFGLVVLLTVSAYMILLLPTYAASELGVPLWEAYLASLITGAAQTVLIPIFGALSDKIGRLRIMGVAAAGILIIAYPMFWLLAEMANFRALLTAQLLFGFLVAAYAGPLPAMMAEMFPARFRVTALSMTYSLAVAIFGGFGPFFSTLLIGLTHSKVAPAYYLAAAAIISLTTILAATRAQIEPQIGRSEIPRSFDA